jgi:hypothetical protein
VPHDSGAFALRRLCSGGEDRGGVPGEPGVVDASPRFAHRDALSVEDLAEVTLLRLLDTLPESLRTDQTPAGRPIRPGRSAATFQEMLTLVGAGEGAFPVGANVRRYYARPDVAYVHLHDAPPLE